MSFQLPKSIKNHVAAMRRRLLLPLLCAARDESEECLQASSSSSIFFSSVFYLLLCFQCPPLLSAARLRTCVYLDAQVHQYVCRFGSVYSSGPGSFFYWQSGHHGYMPCCDLSGSTYHVLSGWYTLSAEDMA